MSGRDIGSRGSKDPERAGRGVFEILAALGIDPASPEFRETPKRVAESYEFLFSGLEEEPERYLEESFPGEYRDPVMIRDIPLYSMCEHHLIPFIGKAHVGYAPDGRVIGLSEIARIVEAYARRPQLQERLTAQIADLLFEPLGSRGSMVVIEAEQLCMTMRGVQKPGSVTVTTAARGVYESDATLRSEFTAHARG
ncbi:GTP cyclohydrolase I FolE [Rubrobacter indicoceani]|uniref:GTP cyclohydrolase I FolE n=1 Tax=Rubrobacter indicoceani TaxID=2051957 RepID=UPI000E5A583F|nr:GTP cyclohydrolase I FolE [Rubrobacter indicoceani]